MKALSCRLDRHSWSEVKGIDYTMEYFAKSNYEDFWATLFRNRNILKTYRKCKKCGLISWCY